MTVSTVTTAAGPSTTHLAVSGTVPSSAQDSESSQQGSQKSQSSQSSQDAANVNELQMMMVGGRDTIEKMVEPMAEKLAEDIKVTGSFYKHRGRCKLCGWQAFGYDEGVKELVKRHALQHWRDLAAGECGQSSVPEQLQGGPPGGQEQQQGEQQKPEQQKQKTT